jgi:hypothetical protein
MKSTTISNIRRVSTEEIEKLLPCEVTSDGRVIGYLGSPDDILVIGDLRLAAQKKLKAMAGMMRAALGKGS